MRLRPRPNRVLSPSPNALTGPLTLSKSDGGDRIKLWTSATKGDGNEVSLPAVYQTPSELPATLYVEGVVWSNAQKDVTLQVSYTYEGVQHVDVIKLSVVRVNMTLAGVGEAQEIMPGGLAG